MSASHSNERPAVPNSTDTIKRRGLLAAVWAAVAAFVLNRTTQPVEAGVDGDVVLGAVNTTATTTSIQCSGGFYALQVLDFAAGAAGILGYSTLYGVIGEATSATTGSTGVWGVTFFPNTFGVLGQSSSGIPVCGKTGGGSSTTVSVYGENTSTSVGGYAVYGLCTHGHAIVGTTAGAAGAAGIVGTTTGPAGTYAGAFYGPVAVVGDFAVFGGAKSAAVPHPDGSHRRLYCMESPESWFEDFGKGQLECGLANIAIDPDFAAVTRLDDYHVFLTTYGGHGELTVTDQTPHGFRVEAKDPASTTRFSWKIVARRKDIAAPRFDTVTMPTKPVPPAMPDTPAVPPRPTPRS